MLLTEEEATTKVCRAGGAVSALMARNDPPPHGQSDPEPTCLGSGCMMWRWGEREEDVESLFVECANPRALEEPPRQEHVPQSYVWQPAIFLLNSPVLMQSARWCEPAEERSGWRFGFCGLAGAPATP
jgi:hypothetical protein